jgi:nitrous oxidase accessory protein
VIADNQVRRARDVVIWFSNNTVVRGNRVTDGRYGLHFMYSHHNRFDDNVFERNDVGAFIMYSGDLVFQNNVFADARGPAGRGLGFKDADSVVAEGNILVKNAAGITIDNSPHLEGVTNLFRGNVVAYNDVGVSLLPSAHDNAFYDNQFVDNVQPVAVSGGGSALANRWSRNYWSDYAGFDPDGDGFGNTPFVQDRLSDDLLAKHQALRLFNASLAVSALNTLSRVLPLLSPQPVVVDSLPRLRRSVP